jgi:hypothetical protein
MSAVARPGRRDRSAPAKRATAEWTVRRRLLVVSNSLSGALGFRRRNSTWSTTVNRCFSQQLVATSKGGLLLLDLSSQYPLLVSKDSDLDWSSYALATNEGANVVNFRPFGSVVLMASDGALFASLTSTSRRQSLLRIDTGSSAWCTVPGASKSGQVAAMRVDGPDLVWTQNESANSCPETSTMHEAAVSKLTG